jgi:fructose-bisphosphate aldolase class II
LFDASELPVEENQRQTIEVVKEAKQYGASVEGEIEAITGVEDGHGSDTLAKRQSLETSLNFIQATGIDVFAPSIGNAHGTYKSTPIIDYDRVSEIVAANPIPIALHGGSGLTNEQFDELIKRGCAKVNISTALKEIYMKSTLDFLLESQKKNKWDPPSLFSATRQTIINMVMDLTQQFGSKGKAW